MNKVWITSKSCIAFLALSILVGCSGGKYYQSWPMESQINGELYHYHNAVQLNLPATMFHATNSENWMENCKTRIESPKTETEFLYPFRDCVRDEQYQLSTMGSVASQFVTPVLTTSMYAGSLAYGLHQVGKGLGKSGDNVNVSNKTNSDNKTTNIKPHTNINSNNILNKK